MPACGYTYTQIFSYTGIHADLADVVKQGSYLTPSFQVETADVSKASATPYTNSISSIITVTSVGQSSTTFNIPATSIALTITNPCEDATITSLSLSATTKSVEDGTPDTVTFSIPSDSVETSTGLVNSDICGTKTYEIVLSGTSTVVTTWAAITDSATAR